MRAELKTGVSEFHWTFFSCNCLAQLLNALFHALNFLKNLWVYMRAQSTRSYYDIYMCMRITVTLIEATKEDESEVSGQIYKEGSTSHIHYYIGEEDEAICKPLLYYNHGSIPYLSQVGALRQQCVECTHYLHVWLLKTGMECLRYVGWLVVSEGSRNSTDIWLMCGRRR